MFQESNLGAAASSVLVPAVLPEPEPQFMTVRHMVFGPLVALQTTIKTLHKRGYAEANDWSQPQPTNDAGEFVTVLTKTLKLQ
ncbi:MAG: hypothetical protein AAF152_18105 [Cyanobacteria bacterium P01_A01_bin.114]